MTTLYFYAFLSLSLSRSLQRFTSTSNSTSFLTLCRSGCIELERFFNYMLSVPLEDSKVHSFIQMHYKQENVKVDMPGGSYVPVANPLPLADEPQIKQTRKTFIIMNGVLLVSFSDEWNRVH
jgi:hypothetical protein